MKKVGYFWNDKNLEIIEQNGEMYVLYGWNGEAYYNCREIHDSQGVDRVEEGTEYILKPVCQGLGIPDEDGT